MTLPMLHSLDANREALKGLEAMGLDSVWLPDHMLGLFHSTLWSEIEASASIPDCDAWLDPFIVGGILGVETSLPIGTSVTDGTRRGGADLARTSMTLNHVSRGGFILGIGAGEAESLVPFGYSFDTPVQSLGRALAHLRSIIDTGRMPDGGVGRIGRPEQHESGPPQVWVAAHGPRMLELTGRYGDGWLPCGLTPAQYGTAYQRVCAAAERYERPKPTASMFPLTVFGDSREQVLSCFEARPLTKLVALFGSAELWRRHGLEHPAGRTCRGFPDVIPHALPVDQMRELAPMVTADLLQEFLLMGNAEEVDDLLDPYRAAGLTHVVLADMTGIVQRPAEMPHCMVQVAKLVELIHDSSALAS